jgi:hypothetical protein
MLTEAAYRNFCRAIEETRRGRVSARVLGDRLLDNLKSKGLLVSEEEPDLEGMAAELVNAGYKVVPPNA